MYGLIEIAEVTGGKICISDTTRGLAVLAGVSIDTRKLRPGEIFFAIRGAERDGHRFIQDAFERGALAAVVSNTWFDETDQQPGGSLIRVTDPLSALQILAAHYRRSLAIRVVAITGSNGKTTTKDMAAQALSRRYRTARTEGNLNNHIGVPLTLLGIPADAEVAVVEMGMNHPGEIARLSEISRPEVGVVTNVGESHLEFMGSVENVLRAKGELLEYLKSGDTAVLNADDPHLMSGGLSIRAGTVTFGIRQRADIRATDVVAVSGEGARFRIGGHTVRLGVPGEEFVYDALAAVAVAVALGVPEGEACEALEGFRPCGMRMEQLRLGTVTVINDAYNANPVSTRAALVTLSRIPGNGRKVAVLGDMLELGAQSPALHREIGGHAAASAVDLLFTVGILSRDIDAGALAAGMPADRVRHFEGRAEVQEALRRQVEEGDVVLVKGSRGCRLEAVVKDLVEYLEGRNQDVERKT
ncbi:MAG: UDP-N-acetylmuramoyl-tripeptide--D-alanyl-D-alanine ligase [Candidatus Eisenbacteria sp.]|nr:UDP-N-acetylmuramoyl-tripeptide--D-alanyl-D-alanine ligase [Candidatus Eisenbacteria bacterium]